MILYNFWNVHAFITKWSYVTPYDPYLPHEEWSVSHCPPQMDVILWQSSYRWEDSNLQENFGVEVLFWVCFE